MHAIESAVDRHLSDVELASANIERTVETVEGVLSQHAARVVAHLTGDPLDNAVHSLKAQSAIDALDDLHAVSSVGSLLDEAVRLGLVAEHHAEAYREYAEDQIAREQRDRLIKRLRADDARKCGLPSPVSASLLCMEPALSHVGRGGDLTHRALVAGRGWRIVTWS